MAGESAAIARDQLVADLSSLGLQPGQDLLIHSSLRRIGPIAGGAATLLAAIMDVAGPMATLVVPTGTTWNSFTSRAFFNETAGRNAEELARYIATMPGFDPATTPSAGVGVFAEHVRTFPGAHRSAHPQSSFAAVGQRARDAMSVHDLDCHLGERSPLGWLYKAGAAVVLLGVSYCVCTAFHLAEYRVAGVLPRREYRCFTASGGVRTTRTFTDIDLIDEDFELIGAALEATTWPDAATAPRHSRVGMAPATLLPMRTAVDFARSWLAEHRRQKHDG